MNEGVNTKPKQSGSAKAKALSARLMAVQAVHQNMHNQKPVKTLLNEYLNKRTAMEVEGETLVEPDGSLLQSIVLGVDERFTDIQDIIYGFRDNKNKDLDPLLQSLLLCGFYEILVRQEIDAPIIINDYLNVAHGFFEQGEVKLINALLDQAAKQLQNKG